jgi:hypothetical protein
MKAAHRVIVIGCITGVLAATRSNAQQADSAGLAAFNAVTSVLMSPRCVNCHVAGDAPLQGNDGHPHIMQIKRGADGRGTPAMPCRSCHQTRNVSALHGPPGMDGWRLPPRSAPMAWHGLSPARLCRNMKDPSMTGGRSLPQLVEHVSDDHLVRWAWDPGPGRSLPPISHEAFIAAFKTWIQEGAPCPAAQGARR